MAKAILLRVAEWGAWLPLEVDYAEPRLHAAQGMTGLQVEDGEKLIEVIVQPVPQAEKHFPVTDSEGLVRNVKHRLHVFRATLASGPSELPDSLFDGPTSAGKSGSVILDPNNVNRAARRSKGDIR